LVRLSNCSKIKSDSYNSLKTHTVNTLVVNLGVNSELELLSDLENT
jgi:hypothetical protein